MKKLLITIISLLLVFPVISFAAYNDVLLSESNTIITTGGINLSVSGQQASLDSITVNADNFSVTLSANAHIEVTSTDKRTFSVSGAIGSVAKTFACNSASSVLGFSNPSTGAGVTLTITPNSDTCSGGVAATPATPATPAIPAVSPAIPAIPATPSSAARPSPVALAVSPAFNRTLKIGMSHFDIKRLQQLLNSDPDTQIAPSGVGSPGNETEYYGSLTRAAVRKFQVKYNIVSSGDEVTTGYGLVGPGTRAKLAEVFSEAKPKALEVVKPSPVAALVSPVFSSGLSRGMSNSDVKRLQELLNSDPDTIISSSGVGSAGNETNYFGTLTEKAVQKFQVKYNVAGQGDPGYGYVGPKTRVKLQKVFSGEPSAKPSVEQESSQTETELEALLKTLQEQVKALQAELEAMQ